MHYKLVVNLGRLLAFAGIAIVLYVRFLQGSQPPRTAFILMALGVLGIVVGYVLRWVKPGSPR